MADQQEGFGLWVFQGYRQCSLVTTKVRRKTKTKPTCCTFCLAAAASLPHHSHLQAQGCLSLMPLLRVQSWPLLRAAFEGDRHNPPSLPCWWLCGAGGADSWLLLPSLPEHRSSRAWQLRFQSHKSASHLGLKVQKTVQAVHLSAKESDFWSVGVGHGGRAEGASSWALCLSKMALLLSLASAGKVSPWEKQTSVLGVFREWSHAWPAWFLYWYVCSDAFQEEQVQHAEVSWRDFCSCISTSVFWLGLTAQGQVLPPRISEEASVVAEKEMSRSSKTVYLGCPELVMAENIFGSLSEAGALRYQHTKNKHSEIELSVAVWSASFSE